VTFESLAHVVLLNLAVVAGLGVLLWSLSLRLRDASIIDLAWGPFFAVIAWATWLRSDSADLARLPLVIAPTLWAIRLFAHLFARNVGHGEDRRYAAMRARRGASFARWSLFAIFLFQPLLATVISLPVQVGILAPRPDGVNLLEIVGAAIFLFGFFFEAVADFQLQRFKRVPANKGAVMERGLWRYSRHPNYFGETVLWWGVWLMAAAAPDARWTFVGPALLTFLLLKVSGVSLLESTITERRPEYAAYQRRTSAFIPRPPR
jgi:steroid 5-alpha reductase family enzyme